MAGQRLSVLQLLPALDSGGVERGTLEIAAGLARGGHRALVVSAGGRLVAQLVACGAEHLDWPIGRKSPSTLALVPRLRRLLLEQRVDVLHARSRLPAWIGWLAWRTLDPARRPRLVTTVHGFYRPGRYSAIMTRGERVICVSDAIRGYVLQNYPRVDPSRLVTIHRGVDRAHFAHGFTPDARWLARWREQHPELADRQLLLLPGRLTRLKGHALFLRLLRALLDQGLAVHGLVAGGEAPGRARYAQQIRDAVAAHRLQTHVSMLGDRSDLRELMAVSDLVLSLSSQPESFGRTVLEALSLGRPVLGLDHGGVGEILAELYPAGRVHRDDFAGLLARALALLEAPPAVEPSSRFDLDTMVKRTLELYRALVAERARS